MDGGEKEDIVPPEHNSEVVRDFYEAMKGDVCPSPEQVRDWIAKCPGMAKAPDPSKDYSSFEVESDDFTQEELEDLSVGLTNYTAPLHAILDCFAKMVSLETIEALVDAWPEALSWEDDSENYPLHIACWNRAPLPIVRYLAEKHPEALWCKINNRYTPIDNVLRREAGLDVLEYFCDKWSRYVFRFHPYMRETILEAALRWDNDLDSDFSTPSVEYLKLLVKYKPDLLSNLTRRCNAPVTILQYALKYFPKEPSNGKWIRIIEWLIEIRPSDVRKCSEHMGKLSNEYPVHTLLERMNYGDKIVTEERLHSLKLLLAQWPEVVTKRCFNDRMLPLDSANRLPRDIMMPLLVGDTKEANVLHFYFHHHGQTMETVKWLLKGNERFLRVQDSSGNLPLHCLLQHWFADEDIVYHLTSLFPESVTIQNHEGQMALHLAAKNTMYKKMIPRLLRRHPDAARQRDNQGWLPFQLAAQNKHLTRHYGRELREKGLVDTVFQLLREAPDMVLQNQVRLPSRKRKSPAS